MSTDPTEASASGHPRQYTTSRKFAIVGEMTEPGVAVPMLARRLGVTPAMIFRWRSKFGMTRKQHPVPVTALVIDTPACGRPKLGLPLVLPNR